MVEKISFSNYKLFKSKQELEIKPITVLFGKNNTGKSAVSKLPIIVSQILKGDDIKWEYKLENDLDNTIEIGNSFKDLIYNRNGIGFLKIIIENKEEKLEFDYNEDAGFAFISYNNSEIDNVEKVNSITEILKNRDYNFDVEFIESIRSETLLNYTDATSNIKGIGNKGQNAIYLLINSFNSDCKLLDSVSSWIQENFEGWELDLLKNDKGTSTTFELVLKRSSNSPINIRQTGQGIQQVYPLLVNSYLNYDQNTLTIIQEPETHLHPAAHANLAERFVNSCLENENRKFLIETHSLNFILRIRALIAKKIIEPSFFNLYYVDFLEDKNESIIRKIEITEDGDIKNNDWPDNVFDESLIEISSIIEAQNEDL